VKRYDILLIQEIRDASETAIEVLREAVNTDVGFVLFFIACNTRVIHSLLSNLRLLRLLLLP